MNPCRIGDWADAELPQLNRAILAGETAPETLAEQVREVLLPQLPDLSQLSVVAAQQLVVRLGLVGASIARHYQEWTPGGKQTPERAFDGLTVGPNRLPFQRYFGALAKHTGTGHCARDSYASLVRWNVGTVHIYRGSDLLAVLPGAFDDGKIRSYTGTGGEERFFLLVKQGEAIELAVNQLLEPLAGDDAGLASDDAIARVRTATELVDALRALLREFAARPPELSMPPEHFMDVFRQFAVHWTTGDIPPSGALDPEALKRDFLLGIGIDGYDQHVRRLFPALLADERAELDVLMAQPTLPERLLSSLGLTPAALREADREQLCRLGAEHPALIEWYKLLTAHARAAGAHLLLSKKFLFKPQQQRDLAGLGDKPLVSNRAGTTGMNESFLERLTRARQDHLLAPFRATISREISEKSSERGVRFDREAAAPVLAALMA